MVLDLLPGVGALWATDWVLLCIVLLGGACASRLPLIRPLGSCPRRSRFLPPLKQPILLKLQQILLDLQLRDELLVLLYLLQLHKVLMLLLHELKDLGVLAILDVLALVHIRRDCLILAFLNGRPLLDLSLAKLINLLDGVVIKKL